MQRKWLAGGGVLVLGALIAYAWVDGGRRPVHEISENIPVPEQHR
ncbi:MAG: hypothetical protein AB7F98_12465 [Novosphingobium sp.]